MNYIISSRELKFYKLSNLYGLSIPINSETPYDSTKFKININTYNNLQNVKNKSLYKSKVINLITNLHKIGIYHGYIQPFNILINDSDNVQIMDFGFSYFIDDIPSLVLNCNFYDYDATNVYDLLNYEISHSSNLCSDT